MNKTNKLLAIGLIVILIASVSALGHWIYSNTIIVTVSDIVLNLECDAPETVLPNTIINFTLTATNNSLPLQDALIWFQVDGINNTSALTDSSGVCHFSYLVVSGSYSFRAAYEVS